MRRKLIQTVLVIPFLAACEQVDTGKRGIKLEFGKVIGEPLSEGLYYYNPFTSSIHEVDVRENTYEGTADCFTRDTQKVSVGFVMTYYPDPTKIHEVFKQFGDEWQNKIVKPAAMGSIKDTIGKYVADDLVGKREEAKNETEKEIIDHLQKRGVIVTRIDFVNLDFEDAYENAVEAKVVAVQKAQEAKNITVRIEEEAKQSIIQAQAEAESMRIRSQALSQSKSLVEYEIATRWDGVLPTHVLGGSIPLINLK